jgi:hypothetical protein
MLPFLLMGQMNCVRDTIRFNSGIIYSITDEDTTEHDYCGIYKLYDSLGVLIEEGNYLKVDSVECNWCYNENVRDSIDRPTQYYKSKHTKTLKVGIWSYYHPNGLIKEKGKYSSKVKEYTEMDYPVEWEGKSWPNPVNVGLAMEYLKDGVWEYYNDQGKLILTEEYVCGSLVHRVIRN